MKNICTKIESLEPDHIKIRDNISKAEKEALDDLRTNEKIIIKKADKTNIMVIMNKEYYRKKLVLQDHLLTDMYETVKTNADKKLMKKQISIVEKYENCLTRHEADCIKNHQWKSSNFYINPKISKCKEISTKINSCNGVYLKMQPPQSLKGRPIIAGPASPIKPLSKLLDKILSPLVPLQGSYIKDDWDFIRSLPGKIDYGCELITCDIVSLYTSIPHDLGITAISFWYDFQTNIIATRFTKEFIIEAITFVLNNNNFQFDSQMWHQTSGTGMGIDFAGPYSCLTVGYLEKVKLFSEQLPRIYDDEQIALIQKVFKRYVDDGFLLWPRRLRIEHFVAILNNLHKSIKFTIERGTAEGVTTTNNFLDVKVILHPNGEIETEIFYKETNNHHYLEYDSFHPQHVKDNIPYGMARKINVFTSDSEKVKKELNDLRKWFKEKKYPDHVVERGIHNALLQGPAPKPVKKDIIPLISTFSSNYSIKSIAKQANILIERCPDDSTRHTFQNKKIVQTHRQPPNLLRTLTSAKFISNTIPKQNGIFHCYRPNCDICNYYLISCKSFKTANGYEWEVRSHITCHSKNVIYFQRCNFCDYESNIGKTNHLRKRTNVHISSCRTGNGTDIFDRHVYHCHQGKNKVGPFFKLWVFMEVDDDKKLLPYENYLQRRGFDTTNRGKPE